MRRDRYASDPAHRQRIRDENRERYRENEAIGDPARFRETCLDNLAKVIQIGRPRAVRFQEERVVGRVYTIADVARLLDRTPAVLYRWIAAGIFPAPVLYDVHGFAYYAQPEVKAFVRIMGEHQRSNRHYRLDHKDTCKQLGCAAFARNQVQCAAWIDQHRYSGDGPPEPLRSYPLLELKNRLTVA
jgi:hypothetical protein